MKNTSISNLYFFALTLLSLLTFSCSDDIDSNIDDTSVEFIDLEKLEEEQNIRIKSLISSETVTTNFIVTVVNTDGVVQPEVNIQIASENRTSNENGFAIFENTTVNEEFTVIKAQKSGYENAIKTVTPSKNGITNVKLMLVSEVEAIPINALEGGIITTTDNVILDFPKEAIIDQSGSLFTGTAKVSIVYYDIDDTNFARTQPAILVGMTEEDDLVGLISEGMLSVNLTDDNGNPLNIGNGKKVQITTPASETSPSIIPLWHLNEPNGLWVEIGQATKKGEVYQFEVSHFSIYNLDIKFENSIDFSVIIEDSNGNPISNQEIRVDFEERTKYIVTDNIGQVNFINGEAGEYIFTVEKECGDLGSSSINVVGNDTYTAVINFATASDSTVFGYSGILVDCDEKPLVNTSFVITVDTINEPLIGRTNDLGNYSLYTLVCGSFSGNQSAKITANTSNGLISTDFSIDLTNPIATLNLSSCGVTILVTDEKQVLLDIYNDNPQSQVALGWDISEPDLGRWEGVDLSADGKISSLNLSEKNLLILPTTIEKLTNLLRLDLTNNYNLTTLPVEIENLTNLKILVLLNINLSALSFDIGKLTNLSRLNLAFNLLSTIPVEIGNLTNLTYLNVNANNLNTIPPDIGKLTNLTNLVLSSNELTIIPVEIGNLTNLKRLDLSNNKLNILPPDIGKLTMLTVLGLSLNELTTIPVEIGNLTNLTLLTINANQINSLHSSICDFRILGNNFKVDPGLCE